MKGRFVRYNGLPAVVVRDGAECTAEAGGELDDHLGLWFGEVDRDGSPLVYTIPTEYVLEQQPLNPVFLH